MSESRPICMVLATSGHSGVDRVVGKLFPAFARTGRRLDILLIRGHGPYPPELPDNVRVWRLPLAHRDLLSPFLVAYLRWRRPTAVLTAGHPLNRAIVISRALAHVPTRLVLRFGMSMEGKAERLGDRQYRRFVRSVARWYARADRVIAPSRGVAQGLMEAAGLPPERVQTVCNPIVDETLEAAALEPLPDPWFEAGAPPVILAAGSLEPRKDFSTLVRAFARVRAARPARLVILGMGAEHDRLGQLAAELGVAEDVRLPGFDANPYRWMARAATFVLSSRHEGSGAVLVEALACGTSVISTDCPSGPREILAGGRYGPLVPVGAPDALAAAIEARLDNPVDRCAMVAAVAPYRVDSAAAAYLSALGVRGDAG